MKQLNYDFVVAGAGLSGMIAAVSAARKGLKVALINDRSVLGGNASSEIDVRMQGSSVNGLNKAIYARETGLMDELRQDLNYAVAYQGYGRAAAADAVFFDFIYREPNISLFLNTVVNGVQVQQGKIQHLYAYQMKTDLNFDFCAPLYADCTGDGIVAYKAGAAFMMGTESKDEYGEKWAPKEKSSQTMGHSIYFEIEDTGHPVEFKRPSFAYDVTKMDFMKDIDNPKKFRALYVSGSWWTLEYGGQVDTIKDNEDIQLELRKLAFGLWDYVKNSGKYPEAANYKMKRLFALAGPRESRRIVGDYVLNENDVENKVKFEDSVLIGGWPMDVHDPEGIYGKLPASNFIPVTGIYNIPFRCLYARDIDNLMMAGRNISVTHIALGSTRVMGTCGAMGQAIGTAAVLCKQYDMLPRQIYHEKIKQLQHELLEDDQTIVGMRDSICPELDAKFQVRASSVRKYENVRQDMLIPNQFNYGLAIPVMTPHVDSVEIKVKNETSCSQLLRVKVMTGSFAETYLPDRLDKILQVELEPDYYGWVRLDVDCTVGEDSKLYLGFDKNKNISLCASDERVPGAVSYIYHDKDGGSGFNHDSWPLDEKTTYIGEDWVKFNINFRNIVPKQDIFRPENVLNGFSRPYGHMNMWLSESVDGQNITLSCGKLERVEQIHLIFDNSLDSDLAFVISPRVVKDYDVILTTKTGEKTISVRNNYQRQNILDIHQEISQVRIEFLNTFGQEKSIGIYAIKFK